MQEHTKAQAIFPDGRVAEMTLPIWLLPLPGDLMTIPGEAGADGGLVVLRVLTRLLRPEPLSGQPWVTLFVDLAAEEPGRPRLSVVR